MTYHTPFGTKPAYWNKEDQDVTNVSDDLIMPRYSRKQEPFVETPRWEAGKYDGLKGMIESYRKIRAWLISEKAKPIFNKQKVKKFEEKLAEIRTCLEQEAKCIMQSLKIDVIQVFNEEYEK